MGIIGAAYSELIGLSLYNLIRFEFLRRKFNLQPFTHKTWQTIVLFAFAFFTSFYLFNVMNNWWGMLGKSLLFTLQIFVLVIVFNLTPDASQLLTTLKKKLSI